MDSTLKKEPVFCSGCLRVNERNKGESWCNDCGEPVCFICAKFHRKLYEPHEIVSLQAAKEISLDIENLQSNCETHSEHKIAFFCPTHYQFSCDVCKNNLHQNCESVISGEKACSDERIMSSFDRLKTRMAERMREMKENSVEYANSLLNLDERKREIVEIIGKLKNKLISKLHEMEQILIKDLEMKCEECKEYTRESKFEFTYKLSAIEKWKNDLEHVRKCPSNVNLLRVIKLFDEKMDDMDQEIEDLKAGKRFAKFQFEQSMQIKRVESGFSFGEVISFHKSNSELNVPVLEDLFYIRDRLRENENPPLIGLISTAKLGDQVEVGSICFTGDNDILIINLKKLDELFLCSQDESYLKKIQLPREAYELAAYDRNLALATTCDGVQIINISPLEAGKLLLPGTSCCQISCMDNQIVIGDVEGKTLTFIDINGNILQKITTSFKQCGITVDADGDIFCKYFDSSDIYIVSKNAEERFAFSLDHIGGATDIAADGKGGIYVFSDWYCGRIYRFSKAGERNGAIVDYCSALYGLSYNHDTNKLLFVCPSRHWKELIKIYQLQ